MEIQCRRNTLMVNPRHKERAAPKGTAVKADNQDQSYIASSPADKLKYMEDLLVRWNAMRLGSKKDFEKYHKTLDKEWEAERECTKRGIVIINHEMDGKFYEEYCGPKADGREIFLQPCPHCKVPRRVGFRMSDAMKKRKFGCDKCEGKSRIGKTPT